MKEEFTYGELVEVRDYDEQEWEKRVYVGTLPHTKRFYCMRKWEDETNYSSWPIRWEQIRKIQKPEPEMIDIQQPETIEQRMDKFEAILNAAIKSINERFDSIENQLK